MEDPVRNVADHDSKALVLALAAQIVGRDMGSEQSMFNGNFPARWQENATIAMLYVGIIYDGPGISLKAKIM